MPIREYHFLPLCNNLFRRDTTECMMHIASATHDRGGSRHLCSPYDSDTRHGQPLAFSMFSIMQLNSKTSLAEHWPTRTNPPRLASQPRRASTSPSQQMCRKHGRKRSCNHASNIRIDNSAKHTWGQAVLVLQQEGTFDKKWSTGLFVQVRLQALGHFRKQRQLLKQDGKIGKSYTDK